MDEAEYCDRVSIMAAGQIKAIGTVPELKAQFGVDTMDDVFLSVANNENAGLMIKRMWAIVIKEMHHIMRDKRSLLILVGMPIAQIILFGYAVTNEIKDAQIVFAGAHDSQIAQELTRKIVSSGFFELEAIVDNEEEAVALFRKGETDVAVVFPPMPDQKLLDMDGLTIRVLADATDPNTATTLDSYIKSITSAYFAEQGGGAAGAAMINVEPIFLYNPELKGVVMFVPGLMTIILMIICAMMTSVTIVREKESGTMEVLLASPASPMLVVFSKVLPYILLGTFIEISILVLGYFVFGVSVVGSLPLLLFMCLIFILACLALGIFISSRTKTQQAALMVSLMALMLPTVILSGFIFPIESMPVLLQWISNLIPAKWFIIIVKNIMLKGAGFEYVWRESLILVGMTIFFLIAAIRNFKYRLE